MASKLNYGKIKLELFCYGLKADPSCNLETDARDILRSRGGLGSGLEMILPDKLYVNVPVDEKFAKSSPYRLFKENDSYYLSKNGHTLCKVLLPPKPAFYSKKTSSGKLMSRIGVMQGTYLGIYPTSVCLFWKMKPKMNCRFCSVGLNLGQTEEMEKSVEDVIETVIAARQEEKITFVHFNTGFFQGRELEMLDPYIKATKNRTGLLVGVQTPPHPDLKHYQKLKMLGVDHVSFCMELNNERVFKEICPGKAQYIGQARFLEAIDYCSKLFGKGRVSGEIIAGLEPPQDSIKAIEKFGKMGAVSTVCVFRPCTGTDMEKTAPPNPEELAPVFAKMYEVCVQNNIPIKIAPNIEVSLVLLPGEGRYFVKNSSIKEIFYGLEITLMKIIYRSLFNIKLFVRRAIKK